MKRLCAQGTVYVLVAVILLLTFNSCQKKEVTLSNPVANEQTVRIYNYIKSLSGNSTLSGQQESTWIDGPDYEVNFLSDATGKLPALRGFDYMNDDFDGVNERAVEWAQNGGLVTICWHTGADYSGAWAEAMADEVADWDALFTEGTPENKAMLDGMDKAAAALKELENQGVTVIWRPFHEFDGAWFWWGKGGPENFKKLWKTMYERYTVKWELNNLIWVLGFSHNGEDYKDWYVGDGYCDIIGADSYDLVEVPMLWKAVGKVNKSGKPQCFHECGKNLSADELGQYPWVWFMTWHSEYLVDTNTKEELNELYNSERVITLDEINY